LDRNHVGNNHGHPPIIWRDNNADHIHRGESSLLRCDLILLKILGDVAFWINPRLIPIIAPRSSGLRGFLPADNPAYCKSPAPKDYAIDLSTDNLSILKRNRYTFGNRVQCTGACIGKSYNREAIYKGSKFEPDSSWRLSKRSSSGLIPRHRYAPIIYITLFYQSDNSMRTDEKMQRPHARQHSTIGP
jgi:hypothetical protein